MKKFISGLFIGLLLVAVPVFATNFTVDLTTAQISDAQWKYGVAPDKALYANINLWAAAQIGNLIAGWHLERQQALADGLCTAFKTQTVTVQNNTCNLIGLANGCDPCDK